MSWIRLHGGFSASAVVLSVEQRFGLIGYARLVKLLELLAASSQCEAGKLSMPISDWLDALQAPRDELHTLLNHLTKTGWLKYSQDDEPGAPLVVDFLQSDTFVPDDTPVLLTSADQWAFWCQTELNMPRLLTDDPYNLQLFRRWCASNVTVTEMQQACDAAIGIKADLSPNSLHKHLQNIRATRLAAAKS